LNIIQPKNGQDPFASNRIVTRALEPKRHNAKLCPLVIRERIVNALAAGDSKFHIAKALRVSRNTVSAVAEQEWFKVEQRKARIAAQAELAATRAFERINNKLDSPDDIPLNILVPVAGVSVDKLLALRGDPSVVARIEHVPGGNIFEAFQRFHNEAIARLDAERAIAEQSPTAQLALPNGETVSDSGR
jgi:hypothetical protein